MTSELLNAVERLRIRASTGALADKSIDDLLDQRLPRIPKKQDHEVLRQEIEKEFLTPPHSFGTEWLNRLQQYAISQVQITAH